MEKLVKSSKIPEELKLRALELLQKLIGIIRENSWALDQADFVRLGYEKKGLLTVTCRVNPKYGCLRCQEEHRAMQFQIRFKTQSITMSCRRERAQEKIFDYSSEEDKESCQVSPLLQQFIDYLIFFRYRQKIQQALQRVSPVDQVFLQDLVVHDGVFGDLLFQHLSPEEVPILRELERLARPAVPADDLFKCYKAWLKQKRPKSHGRLGFSRFTKQVKDFIPFVATKSVLAKISPLFDLDKVIISERLVDSVILDRLSKILSS